MIIVGYQSEGSLGRRLVDGDKLVSIFGEKIAVVPWLQIFNVFNNNSLAANNYGGLGDTFGSLNYAYQSGDIPGLTSQRGRQKATRLMQIGVRVTF